MSSDPPVDKKKKIRTKSENNDLFDYVEGVISDYDTGIGLEGVLINVEGLGNYYSQSGGKYKILLENPRDNTIQLNFILYGYEKVRRNSSITETNQISLKKIKS